MQGLAEKKLNRVPLGRPFMRCRPAQIYVIRFSTVHCVHPCSPSLRESTIVRDVDASLCADEVLEEFSAAGV